MKGLLCLRTPFFSPYNTYLFLFRNVRNVSKQRTAIKTLKDFKVKNDVDESDYSYRDYKELYKGIKENDLDIEETFTKGEDFDTIITESSKLYDVHISEEKASKSFIKKKLVGRKYFKGEKETNLLTYAAKEQIKFLHQLNPADWSPETLAQSFPISIAGVKKLLKSNFVMPSLERIKEHDEDVRRKWEILKSGKTSDSISFHTQCLWNFGKLLKENYNGNPKLPNTPKSTNHVLKKDTKSIARGEFSAIVQKYVDYKSQKDSSQDNGSELTVKSQNLNTSKILSRNIDSEYEIPEHFRKSKLFRDKENKLNKKVGYLEEPELPVSQFKENLKQELQNKKKSSVSKQFLEWMEQDLKKQDIQVSKKVCDTEEFLSKISKYNKEKIEIKWKKSDKKNFYVYDNKLGYQHPAGKVVCGKIRLPTDSEKSNNVYKKGQCVYDKDGEFLYKITC